jgi:hypothetical protein
MRGWGSRRDANLRSRVQLLESRIKLAQQAMAIIDVTELLSYLERAENLLAGVEGGGR